MKVEGDVSNSWMNVLWLQSIGEWVVGERCPSAMCLQCGCTALFGDDNVDGLGDTVRLNGRDEDGSRAISDLKVCWI